MTDTVEKSLNHLIDICEDARVFYTDAIEQTNDPEMKQLFRNMADIRKGVVIELRAHMRNKNLEIEDANETMGGQMNKFIGENMAKISKNVDKTLISYLEEAEDRCLHSFEDVANDNEIPADTRGLISMELYSLQKTHDYMKELKEAMSIVA